jgi:L-2-hydroxycarboxylate dehydrogenase (NAD+)
VSADPGVERKRRIPADRRRAVGGARPGQDGHLFGAIRIAAFEEPNHFKRRIDRIVREVHGSRRRAGVDRVWVPGELEAEAERRYRREGIPLNDATLDARARTARRVAVAVPAEFVARQAP